MPAQTLFDKIWDRHVIADLGDGYALLHISRHLMHDGGGRGLQAIKDAGYRVRNPDLTFATFDHVISTEPGRTHETLKPYAQRLYHMRDEAKRWGIKLFDLGQPGQGIVHVMGARAGRQPARAPCWCAATATPARMAALGAIAFGVGATEVIHVLATQSLVQPKPKRMRVTFERQARARRHAQGHDPAPDRPDRRRRRHRLCRRVCRQRHPRHGGRRPAHRVQSLDRARRQDRHDRARREDLRVPEGPALCAQGRAVGPGGRRLAIAGERPRTRCSTPR